MGLGVSSSFSPEYVDYWTGLKYMHHKEGVDLYDYAVMEITWDNGNTTTTRWDGRGPELFGTQLFGHEWFVGRLFGPELFAGTCQGKTQRQIDLDIYHGRVEGYNHWQRIGARHESGPPVRIRHRLMY